MTFTYNKRYYQILDDKAATGKSGAVFVGDCKEIEILIVGTDTAVGTVKVLAGYQPVSQNSGAAVAFGTASSKTNQWGYQHSYNKDSNTAIAGSTGLRISADGTYRLMINTNQAEWIGLEVSAFTTGKFSAYVYGKN